MIDVSDIGVIMATVSTSAVNNHTKQLIARVVRTCGMFYRILHELGEIDLDRKLESARFFVPLVGLEIVGEAKQREREHGRQRFELTVLFGIAILVVALLTSVLIRSA